MKVGGRAGAGEAERTYDKANVYNFSLSVNRHPSDLFTRELVSECNVVLYESLQDPNPNVDFVGRDARNWWGW